MEKTIVLRNNVSVSYEEYPQNKKTNLVFIHGNSLDKSSFRYQKDIESNLYFLDLIGHGNSSHSENPAENYNLPFYGELVADFIQKKELKNVVLVGHSLGGHVAIHALEFLSNVKGLFLFGTPPLRFPPNIPEAFLPSEIGGLFYQPDISREQAMAMASLLDSEDAANEIVSSILNTDPNCRSHLLASVGEGKIRNEVDILQSTQIKIFLGIGAKDRLVNRAYLNSLMDLNLFEHRIHEFDAGHCPQLTNPSAFNSLLNQFIAHF